MGRSLSGQSVSIASPILDVPLLNGLDDTTHPCAPGQFEPGRWGGIRSATTNSAVDVNLVNYTGAGVLNFCGAGSNGSGGILTILIDGEQKFVSAAVSSTLYVVPVGTVTLHPAAGTYPDWIPPVCLQEIPFKSSLVIKGRSASGILTVGYKFRKTA